MESRIFNLVTQFEKGSLSRRDLVQGLAILAAGGTAASAAQDEIDFRTASIDHVSIQVADLQRSIDFYQKTFDFPVMSHDQQETGVEPRHPRRRSSLRGSDL